MIGFMMAGVVGMDCNVAQTGRGYFGGGGSVWPSGKTKDCVATIVRRGGGGGVCSSGKTMDAIGLGSWAETGNTPVRMSKLESNMMNSLG
jgi:hypothetical protein